MNLRKGLLKFGVLILFIWLNSGCMKQTKYTEDELLNQPFPSHSSELFVSTFDRYTSQVEKGSRDFDAAVKRSMQKSVSNLRFKAIEQAATEINSSLDRPLSDSDLDARINKANALHNKFVNEFKLLEQEVQQFSSKSSEVILSGYFKINKVPLKKFLVDTVRATGAVSKYRTYVEAYWNRADKDINPEVMSVVIGNIEDYLSKSGYEVVEFQRIKGDLVELLNKEDGDIGDIYSQDELRRFEANLELRNIDSKFENGKRILADYADLLIGVTVNSLEINNRKIKVRITVDATLFENGEWVKLGSSDRSAITPYRRGDVDGVIAVSKQAVLLAITDLEAKARKKIFLRKAQDDVRLNEEREFTLIFKNTNRKSFRDLRRKIKSSSNWVYKGADYKTRFIRLGYRGRVDNLADDVEDFLIESGVEQGIPSYTSGQNRILFGGKK